VSVIDDKVSFTIAGNNELKLIDSKIKLVPIRQLKTIKRAMNSD